MFFAFLPFGLPIHSGHFRRLLCRILCRAGEVLIGDLQVMLLCNRPAVSQPRAGSDTPRQARSAGLTATQRETSSSADPVMFPPISASIFTFNASACRAVALPMRTVLRVPSPATKRIRLRPRLSLPMDAMIHLPFVVRSVSYPIRGLFAFSSGSAIIARMASNTMENLRSYLRSRLSSRFANSELDASSCRNRTNARMISC